MSAEGRGAGGRDPGAGDEPVDEALATFAADLAPLGQDRRGRIDAAVADAVEGHLPTVQLDPDRRRRIDAAVAGAVSDVDGEPAEVAELTGAPEVGAAHARPRSRGRVLAAAATVLILVAVAVLASRSGEIDTASSPAPPTFAELAALAAAQPATPLTEGRFAHRRVATGTRRPTAGVTERVEERTTDVWVGADGSTREAQGDLVATTGTDRDVLVPASAVTFGPGQYPHPTGLPEDQLAALPTEPAALAAEVDAATAAGVSGLPEAMIEVAAWPTTPPEVRAAAIEWFEDRDSALEPGVADAAGRPGVGVLALVDQAVFVAVLDEETAEPLGWYELPAGARLDPTVARAWTVYEAADITDSPS